MGLLQDPVWTRAGPVPTPAAPDYSQGVEDWFQHWFDADYAELYADRDAAEAETGVDTALQAAPELGRGPVMDLACGSGRHLEALRLRNPLAFGLDLSMPLLQLAGPAMRPWLLQGDMRRLPVRPASLSGICLWFTPFGYFGDAENRRLFQELAACLKPGGILWMDYLNAPAVRAALSTAPETVEKGGLRVHIRRSLEGNRVVKRMRLERPATGEVREVAESVRLYDPEDLERIAAAAGLTVRRTLGGYDGSGFGPASERWIGIFVNSE
jgi:SAM-dependent methyltransferase